MPPTAIREKSRSHSKNALACTASGAFSRCSSRITSRVQETRSVACGHRSLITSGPDGAALSCDPVSTEGLRSAASANNGKRKSRKRITYESYSQVGCRQNDSPAVFPPQLHHVERDLLRLTCHHIPDRYPPAAFRVVVGQRNAFGMRSVFQQQVPLVEFIALTRGCLHLQPRNSETLSGKGFARQHNFELLAGLHLRRNFHC